MPFNSLWTQERARGPAEAEDLARYTALLFLYFHKIFSAESSSVTSLYVVDKPVCSPLSAERCQQAVNGLDRLFWELQRDDFGSEEWKQTDEKEFINDFHNRHCTVHIYLQIKDKINTQHLNEIGRFKFLAPFPCFQFLAGEPRRILRKRCCNKRIVGTTNYPNWQLVHSISCSQIDPILCSSRALRSAHICATL